MARRRPKMRLPAALSPHRAVILGIDPGATSGWALLYVDAHGRERLEAGTCRGASRDVVDRALALAAETGLPLVVVAERWSAGGWASHTTLLGLGAAWGAWLAALDGRVPKRRIVRVYSQTWRAAIIGGRQRSTEAWKESACRVAFVRWGVVLGPDAAEAACIAAWGARAGEVGAALPKSRAGRRRATT